MPTGAELFFSEGGVSSSSSSSSKRGRGADRPGWRLVKFIKGEVGCENANFARHLPRQVFGIPIKAARFARVDLAGWADASLRRHFAISMFDLNPRRRHRNASAHLYAAFFRTVAPACIP